MKRRESVMLMTQYPVVESVRAAIDDRFGDQTPILVISTLAANGYLDLYKQLRSLQCDHVVIFIQDEAVRPLSPILEVLSLAVPAKRRSILFKDEQVQPFGLLRVSASAMSIASSLALGFVALSHSFLRSKRLERTARCRILESDKDATRHISYLKTNLWLGVQAGGALSHTNGVISGALDLGAKVNYFGADRNNLTEHENLTFVSVQPERTYVVPREFNHFLYHRSFVKTSAPFFSRGGGVIYQRASIGNFSGVELSRRFKQPLIMEYNGSESWLAKNWGTPFMFPQCIALAEKISLRHAHLVATVSDALKRELVESGIDEERIVVYPNGVDPKRFDSAAFDADEVALFRAKFGLPDDATVVTFVGTFGPWHGAEVLARAAEEIFVNAKYRRVAEDSKLYFLFVGDGVRRPVVEQYAAHAIKSGRVIIAGLVASDVIPIALASSDILAAPTVRNPDASEFFGSPTKLFEYMAASRPIVASELGQIAEIFEGSPSVRELDDDCLPPVDGSIMGVTTEPGSHTQLAKGICLLAKNPEWRHEAGVVARRRVHEKYTWGHHVEAIVGRLDDVIVKDKASRTRVFINALHSKSGGGVTYLLNILPLLGNDNRLDLNICIQRGQLPLFEQCLDNIKVHVVDDYDGLIRLIVFEQFQFPLMALREGADVVFSPANYGPLFVRRSVILLRNSLSVAFVDKRPSKILYWVLLYLATGLSIFRAKRAISVSEYAIKTAAGGVLNLFSTPFSTISHGISSLFGKHASTPRRKDQFLAVSDLYIQKNLHTLFDAFAKICEAHPSLTLTVAGSPVDATYAALLQRRVRELGLEDRIIFLGTVAAEELAKLYAECTLFVFPSTVETFGNPLVEAMASGCPIASSNTAAMPEVAGDAAEYFDPHNVQDMVRVILELLENEDRRRELSERAIERSKMYSWEETARKTADVLIEAAQS